jgi:DNA-binding NarL/FixJ family response regulator
MKANPEVLILEDDPATMEGLRGHFTNKRFHPLTSRSASRALVLLENNKDSSRPVLAIVDWDLSKAPDHDAGTGEVLSRLARELPDCLVVVYSQNIDAFHVRSEIQRAHPRAWLHDKRDGDNSLLQRIDRMLDRAVGDLRVHEGTVVIHGPTQDEHHHREAIRLAVHYPEIVTFHSDTATKAVRRFGEWLTQHESMVRLVSHGNRKYRLSVGTEARSAAPD